MFRGVYSATVEILPLTFDSLLFYLKFSTSQTPFVVVVYLRFQFYRGSAKYIYIVFLLFKLHTAISFGIASVSIRNIGGFV